jgi:hypothetical protein
MRWGGDRGRAKERGCAHIAITIPRAFGMQLLDALAGLGAPYRGGCEVSGNARKRGHSIWVTSGRPNRSSWSLRIKDHGDFEDFPAIPGRHCCACVAAGRAAGLFCNVPGVTFLADGCPSGGCSHNSGAIHGAP